MRRVNRGKRSGAGAPEFWRVRHGRWRRRAKAGIGAPLFRRSFNARWLLVALALYVLYDFLLTGVPSFLLLWMRERTGSIVMPILAHNIANGVSTLI